MTTVVVQVVVDKRGRMAVRHNNLSEDINAVVLLLAMVCNNNLCRDYSKKKLKKPTIAIFTGRAESRHSDGVGRR
jgi:hypothetical protein